MDVLRTNTAKKQSHSCSADWKSARQACQQGPHCIINLEQSYKWRVHEDISLIYRIGSHLGHP